MTRRRVQVSGLFVHVFLTLAIIAVLILMTLGVACILDLRKENVNVWRVFEGALPSRIENGSGLRARTVPAVEHRLTSDADANLGRVWSRQRRKCEEPRQPDVR